MPLSIIIVNYKSAGLLLDCLERLWQHPAARTFEVIVCDNASGDDSEERVMKRFPGTVWIQIGENAGFARANNAGIRQAKGEVVLLLNADTLPDAQVVDECYQRLRQSDFIAAGVQLLNADGSPQISGMYVMKGGLNYLLPLPILGKVLKKLGESARVKKPHVADSETLVEVDWINGAFLMVKQSAIEKAGLLDPDFFLYAEEAEWCSRLKKTGRLCIYGDLKVIHLQGETANQEFGSEGKGYHSLFDRKGLQIMLSNFVRIRKQFGAVWFLVQLLFYLSEIPLFLVSICLNTLLKKKPRYRMTQFCGYCKNIFYILRLSPVILRNKPYFYKVL